MTIEVVTANVISGISTPLYVIPLPIQVLLSCLIACNQHPGCGGVIKYPTDKFKCELVVDPDEPGATLTSEKAAYRTLYYGTRKLVSIPSDIHITSDFAQGKCNSLNGNLVQYASTLKMRATLTIRKRPYFYVDLKRGSDGIMRDSNGVEADMSKINWSGANPHGGNENCIGSGYNTLAYFDFPCSTEELAPYEILCVF